MKLVIIESPYAGAVVTNQKYARACMLDSLKRGEAPFASHLLYTQVLDDRNTCERNLGIEAGFAFKQVIKTVIVYTDLGISYGMQLGIDNARKNNCDIIYRQIFKNL